MNHLFSAVDGVIGNLNARINHLENTFITMNATHDKLMREHWEEVDKLTKENNELRTSKEAERINHIRELENIRRVGQETIDATDKKYEQTLASYESYRTNIEAQLKEAEDIVRNAAFIRNSTYSLKEKAKKYYKKFMR